jgi:hypothetical protein
LAVAVAVASICRRAFRLYGDHATDAPGPRLPAPRHSGVAERFLPLVGRQCTMEFSLEVAVPRDMAGKAREACRTDFKEGPS